MHNSIGGAKTKTSANAFCLRFCPLMSVCAFECWADLNSVHGKEVDSLAFWKKRKKDIN